MCPLRLILIFLSATLAGFFVIRNLKSQQIDVVDDGDDENSAKFDPNTGNLLNHQNPNSTSSIGRFSKVKAGLESGFWTCVDMASGRYLWKHLVSSSSSKRVS